MSIDESQLVPLRDICDEARIVTDGPYTFVLLSALRVRSGDQVLVIDALLCPQEHEGYVTRLFLDREVSGKGANWKAHAFLGRTWYAHSWQNVPKEQTLIEMLLAHLDPLA